jgi:hypothetical protein
MPGQVEHDEGRDDGDGRVRRADLLVVAPVTILGCNPMLRHKERRLNEKWHQIWHLRQMFHKKLARLLNKTEIFCILKRTSLLAAA